MQKESLLAMMIKTFVVFLLLMGISMVIGLWGYMVEEYSENRNDNQIIKPTNQEAEIDWKSCDQDSDCVETQASCCDCENGGEQTGINKKYLKNWENVLAEKCQDVGCITLFSCKKGKAICENNECEFKEEINDDNQPNTSNWQTYRNEEFGFEFDYKTFDSKVCIPRMYGPNIYDGGIMFCLVNKDDESVPYSDFRISVLQNPKELSAKEFIENRKELASSLDQLYHSGANMTEQEIQVNGYDAYLYNNVWGGDCGMKIYYIVHKDRAMQISFTGSTSNYDNMEYNLGIVQSNAFLVQIYRKRQKLTKNKYYI